MLRAIRVFLALLVCLIILIMALLALPMSRHETVAYSRAFVAFNDAPTDATQRELSKVTATENQDFLHTELVLCLLLISASLAVGYVTRRFRAQNI